MLVNGVHLLPDISGALLWPKERLLVVADLHLEKGSAHAARGGLLPPYDMRATLDRLTRVLRQVQPRTVVCLGDSVHDKGGAGRMPEQDAEMLRRLVGSCEWIWVTGNHDATLPDILGGRMAAELVRGDLTFRHEPRGAAAPGEVAGHLHPKAAVLTAGGRMVRPCFVMDGRRLVMPAFGTCTGGLDVLDPAFRPLFKRGFQVVMLGKDRLHSFLRCRLDGGERPPYQEMPNERRSASPSGTKHKLL